MSEQQRGKLEHTSISLGLVSHLKLYVCEKGDDEGIAYIEQILIKDNIECVKLGYRVKFAQNKEGLSRSVKKFADLTQIIAKL